jgi:hypothetical protein
MVELNYTIENLKHAGSVWVPHAHTKYGRKSTGTIMHISQ